MMQMEAEGGVGDVEDVEDGEGVHPGWDVVEQPGANTHLGRRT